MDLDRSTPAHIPSWNRAAGGHVVKVVLQLAGVLLERSHDGSLVGRRLAELTTNRHGQQPTIGYRLLHPIFTYSIGDPGAWLAAESVIGCPCAEH